MADKKCPDCAEMVKAEAKVCRFCGHRFDGTASEGAKAQAKKPGGLSGIGGCLGLIALIFVIGAIGGQCTADPQKEAADRAAADAKTALDKKKGFHCLSSWDGSHKGVVDAAKAGLREPDSFEHVETRITPVSAKGDHALAMKYRARNGFGGMNVESLVAKVKNSDCSATILDTD